MLDNLINIWRDISYSIHVSSTIILNIFGCQLSRLSINWNSVFVIFYNLFMHGNSSLFCKKQKPTLLLLAYKGD